jgi:hypothetical protein
VLHTALIFALNTLPLLVSIVIYVVWIRPTIRNLPHIATFYDEADTFWSRVMIWMRTQWDILVSGLLIIWPQIPDILQALMTADMSAFIPTETTKLINQVIGVLLILLRAFNIKKTS